MNEVILDILDCRTILTEDMASGIRNGNENALIDEVFRNMFNERFGLLSDEDYRKENARFCDVVRKVSSKLRQEISSGRVSIWESYEDGMTFTVHTVEDKLVFEIVSCKI